MTHTRGSGQIRKWVVGQQGCRDFVAVVAVGSVALLAGCVVPVTPPTESSSPATSPTAASVSPSPVMSVEVSETDPGVGWGPFPPNHLDTARDLSDPQFPEEISTFTLDDVSMGAVSDIASYTDLTNYLAVDATVISGVTAYEVIVKTLQDAAYQGRAVCGSPTKFPEQTVCVMVGTNQVLEVGTAFDIPMEQVVAFTEEIYELL